MAHETIIYGMIEGAFTVAGYDKFQTKNAEVLSALPSEFDEYPGLAREIFSWPPPEPMKGSFRAQVIHFGGSYKNIDAGYRDIAIWIEKFEKLLGQLYWFRAVAHFEAERLGTLRFEYEPADEIVASYRQRAPIPTSKWKREFFVSGKRYDFESLVHH